MYSLTLWCVLITFAVATLALAVYGIHLYVLLYLFPRRAASRREAQQAIIRTFRECRCDDQWQVVTSQIRPFEEGDDPDDKISGDVDGQEETIDYVATEDLAVLDPRVFYGPQSGFSFSRFQIHLSIGQAF